MRAREREKERERESTPSGSTSLLLRRREGAEVGERVCVTLLETGIIRASLHGSASAHDPGLPVAREARGPRACRQGGRRRFEGCQDFRYCFMTCVCVFVCVGGCVCVWVGGCGWVGVYVSWSTGFEGCQHFRYWFRCSLFMARYTLPDARPLLMYCRFLPALPVGGG